MSRRGTIPKQVRHAVNDALELLQHHEWEVHPSDGTATPDPLPSLLDQCGALASQPQEREPVRLIHHFACTGGTVITKCLACSPNAHVLSEVDPLSTLTPVGGKFTPTNLIQLVQFSNRPQTVEESIELFMSSLSALHESNHSKGLRLLIRDHAHSHFCVGAAVPERPTLADMIRRKFPLRSVLTVRHPLDSWLSLGKNGWVHFSPPTIDEYAARYEAFLDAYKGEPLFRYEDLLDSPDEILEAICDVLQIPFPDDYRSLFWVHSFSGDSGRKGSALKPRPRQPVSKKLKYELQESRSLRSLCKRLGYSLP